MAVAVAAILETQQVGTVAVAVEVEVVLVPKRRMGEIQDRPLSCQSHVVDDGMIDATTKAL